MAIASTAKSYGQILGSNDRLNFAVIGLQWPRLCASLLAQGQQERRAHLPCLRCGFQHPEEVCRNTEREMGEAPATRQGLSFTYSN